MPKCPRCTKCPGSQKEFIMKFTAFPVNSSGKSPIPDAVTDIDVMFVCELHFTSAMKNGCRKEDVKLSVLNSRLNTEGATIFALASAANRTNETEPLTTYKSNVITCICAQFKQILTLRP
jgi:hypothetical protein